MNNYTQCNNRVIKARTPIRERYSKTPTPGKNVHNNEHDQSPSTEDEEADNSWPTHYIPESADFSFTKRSETSPRQNQHSPQYSSVQNSRTVNKAKISESNQDTGMGTAKILLTVLMVIIIAVAVGKKIKGSTNRTSCSFEGLQKQYPEQLIETWQSIQSGVESIINKRSKMPAVYLLLHQGGSNVSPLVRSIVERASECLDDSKKPAVMSSVDFGLSQSDYGHAIEQFQAHVKKHRVVLIENLNEIATEAARALHTICDTYSPIKADVAIFLTLKTAEHNGKAMKIAEKALHELWRTLKSNELDALIARVTDQVVVLRN